MYLPQLNVYQVALFVQGYLFRGVHVPVRICPRGICVGEYIYIYHFLGISVWGYMPGGYMF